MVYDVIIENGRILDGSGNPWFKADVGIKDDKIVAIANLKDVVAKERIDAGNQIVAPGFIDIHCHSDALLYVRPREQGKILQGVTTETIGNCGMSATPTDAEHLALLQKYTASIFAGIEMPWDWKNTHEFLNSLEDQQVISNIASLVGHGTVRIAVMGFENREPTVEELEKMKNLVAQELEQGAFGLSSGLIYPPGLFSKTPEMAELCKVVAAGQGIYTTHMRGETDDVLKSVEEAISIAEQSGVAVEISHHKTAGKENWGKSQQTLQLVEAARQRGLDVTCDMYPYIAASTMLGALLPPWVQEGGVEELLKRLQQPEARKRIKQDIVAGIPGWENYVKASGWAGITIASCNLNKTYEGKTLVEIAALRQIEPADALFELMIEEKAEVLMVVFMMCEEDVAAIMKHPAVMVASDAIPSSGKPHPRYYGTFPRVLGKYVREDKVLSLPEGVRKITSMPAQKLGLKDRGMLREGMYADIVIFDPDTIRDKATYMNPQQYAEGISYVLVNGRVAVRTGEYTGALAGKILRKK